MYFSELDREATSQFTFFVNATDGCPYLARTRTVRVDITILDSNDHRPVFSQCYYRFTLSQGVAASQYVGTVVATDADIGFNGQITYQLSDPSQYFQLDATTGQIMTKKQLDAQSLGQNVLRIVATDGGSPSKNSTGEMQN